MVPRLLEELLALILEKIALPRYDTFGLEERRDGLRSSVAALRNVCLASKTMYSLARPMLYAKFSNRRILGGRGVTLEGLTQLDFSKQFAPNPSTD